MPNAERYANSVKSLLYRCRFEQSDIGENCIAVTDYPIINFQIEIEMSTEIRGKLLFNLKVLKNLSVFALRENPIL